MAKKATTKKKKATRKPRENLWLGLDTDGGGYVLMLESKRPAKSNGGDWYGTVDIDPDLWHRMFGPRHKYRLKPGELVRFTGL
jgi:hypothetical protein